MPYTVAGIDVHKKVLMVVLQRFRKAVSGWAQPLERNGVLCCGRQGEELQRRFFARWLGVCRRLGGVEGRRGE
jgi:hypothetical protein